MKIQILEFYFAIKSIIDFKILSRIDYQDRVREIVKLIESFHGKIFSSFKEILKGSSVLKHN